MTPSRATATAWGLTAAQIVPIAQAGSERMPLAVAILIGVAVLTVVARLLVLLVRKESGVEPRGTEGPAPSSDADRRLWGSGAADAGAQSGDAPERDPARSTSSRGPEREKTPRRRPVVAPPQPRERWTATIGWATEDARFRVLARRDDEPDAEPVVLAQTEVLPWPPTDDASVQALTDASAVLESVLLESGWTSLPGGEAWYAKRFAWQPRRVAGNGRRGSGRFERPSAAMPDPVPHDGEPRGR